jgi:hypothetical protein
MRMRLRIRMRVGDGIQSKSSEFKSREFEPEFWLMTGKYYV